MSWSTSRDIFDNLREFERSHVETTLTQLNRQSDKEHLIYCEHNHIETDY